MKIVRTDVYFLVLVAVVNMLVPFSELYSYSLGVQAVKAEEQSGILRELIELSYLLGVGDALGATLVKSSLPSTFG